MPFSSPTPESPSQAMIYLTHLPTGAASSFVFSVDYSMTSDTAATAALQALVDAIDASPDLRLDSATKMWTISRDVTPTGAEPQ
ncbi:hypothetical protein ACGFI9_12095 [Micromonospora sp. NPDC048930]|uniref:hypothetical protein n=1 Tax=Micromonospora sp. NPDC048930 TaxID=3364261 RepID=UPI00371DD0DC